ncbi:hypothetical protein P7C73_g1719, partial [Tremellales sp. Uapishka_1]
MLAQGEGMGLKAWIGNAEGGRLSPNRFVFKEYRETFHPRVGTAGPHSEAYLECEEKKEFAVHIQVSRKLEETPDLGFSLFIDGQVVVQEMAFWGRNMYIPTVDIKREGKWVKCALAFASMPTVEEKEQATLTEAMRETLGTIVLVIHKGPLDQEYLASTANHPRMFLPPQPLRSDSTQPEKDDSRLLAFNSTPKSSSSSYVDRVQTSNATIYEKEKKPVPIPEPPPRPQSPEAIPDTPYTHEPSPLSLFDLARLLKAEKPDPLFYKFTWKYNNRFNLVKLKIIEDPVIEATLRSNPVPKRKRVPKSPIPSSSSSDEADVGSSAALILAQKEMIQQLEARLNKVEAKREAKGKKHDKKGKKAKVVIDLSLSD